MNAEASYKIRIYLNASVIKEHGTGAADNNGRDDDDKICDWGYHVLGLH